MWMGKKYARLDIFQLIKVGRECIKSKLLPHKMIRDYAYPVRPWIYSPFKGCGEGLEGYKEK